MGRRRRIAAALATTVVCALASACQPAPPPAWSSRLVSLNTDGVGSGNSDMPVFSPDGAKVAFTSYAGSFGATDTNDQPDVYVADLATGKVSLVSVNQAGTDAGERGTMGAPVFDPTGTKILFTSGSGDLVAGDTNGQTDVFVRDLVAGTTTLVSATPTGGPGDYGSGGPVVSPDGTHVAFTSIATNLVPGVVDDNGGYDVFVRDLGTATTSLVSAGPDGHAAGADTVGGFTPDGRALLLGSFRDLTGTGAAPPGDNAFMRDLTDGRTTLVTPRPDAPTDFSVLEDLALSPDGTKVAFVTYSAGFGPTDTNRTFDVYVRDLTTGTTALVSADASGRDAGNAGSFHPVFSPDSARLAFSSYAGDLGPIDTHETMDVYLRDLRTATTSLVSVNAAGTDSGSGRSGSDSPVAFDRTGTRIAFTSDAGDLGPHDTNFITDVYVRDLGFGLTTLVSANVAGTDAGDSFSGQRSPVSFSPDGTRVVYESYALSLDPRTSPGRHDVFLATPPALADLGVTAAIGPDPAPAGGEVTLTATATNHGPGAAERGKLWVLLPEATTFVAARGDATCADPAPEQPRVVVCDVDPLPVGGKATVTVTAAVTAPAGSTLQGVAVASSPTFDPGGEDATAPVSVPVAG